MNCEISIALVKGTSVPASRIPRVLREPREFNDPWRGGTVRDRDFLQLSRNLLGLQSTLMQILNPQQPQKIIIIEENGKNESFFPCQNVSRKHLHKSWLVVRMIQGTSNMC